MKKRILKITAGLSLAFMTYFLYDAIDEIIYFYPRHGLGLFEVCYLACPVFIIITSFLAIFNKSPLSFDSKMLFSVICILSLLSSLYLVLMIFPLIFGPGCIRANLRGILIHSVGSLSCFWVSANMVGRIIWRDKPKPEDGVGITFAEQTKKEAERSDVPK